MGACAPLQEIIAGLGEHFSEDVHLIDDLHYTKANQPIIRCLQAQFVTVSVLKSLDQAYADGSTNPPRGFKTGHDADHIDGHNPRKPLQS